MAYTKQVTLLWAKSPFESLSGEEFVRENMEFLDPMKADGRTESDATMGDKSRIRKFRDEESAQAWMDFHAAQIIKHGLTDSLASRTMSDITE